MAVAAAGSLRPGQKLHQSLSDIFSLRASSHAMLPYFVQYMDARKAVHLVEFWLVVESFAAGHHTQGLSPSAAPSPTPSCYGAPVPPGPEGSRKLSRSAGQEPSVGSPTSGDPAPSTEGDCTGSLPFDTPCSVDSDSSKLGIVESSNLPVRNSKSVVGSSLLPVNSSIFVSRPSNPAPDSGNVARNSSSDLSSTSSKLVEHSSNLATVQDAVEIYTTFVALNALKPVNVKDHIRQEIEVQLCPEDDSSVSASCFNSAQEAVFTYIEQSYYPGFLTSPALAQYQLQTLACEKVNLLDILNCPNTAILFREYMEQEGLAHQLDFWYACQHFSQALRAQAAPRDCGQGNLDHAMAIYDRYVSLQAEERVVLSDALRQQVELLICSEEGPEWNSFSDAQEGLLARMQSEHLLPFKQCQLFLLYHAKLLHSVCEEDHFEGRRKSEQHCEEETREPYDLDDPSELWNKPKLCFRFGYVNEIGTFVSEANLESFLRTKDGKPLPEGKFHKMVGRQPLYSKAARYTIPMARDIIQSTRSEIIEFGAEPG